MSSVGQRLAQERGRIGLNQSDFAAAGGCGRASQVNYETGKRAPDSDYLVAVARIGVDVQYVLTGVRSANAGPCVRDASAVYGSALARRLGDLSPRQRKALEGLLDAFTPHANDASTT
jgi:transcriptional regulator with XRE-family HTH domain